jgi:glycosyltransferase involved in cell wall biosynthesis
MKKIKLAVILDQTITSGGGFQQSLNAVLLINKLQKKINIDIIFFTTLKENINLLLEYGIRFNYINVSFVNKLFSYVKSKIYHPRILNFLKLLNRYSKFEKVMIENDIDLIYFTSPSSLAKEVDKLNYILTVWDLNYLYNNEFPEFRENEITNSIHHFYHSSIKKATAIIVDSEMSKNDIAANYLINKNRVHVIPFEAGQNIKNYLSKNSLNQVDIKKKYHVKYPYIFYPAQFWPHKNHAYILNGIKVLEDKFNIKISAIFAGNDQGNIGFVKDLVKELKLEEQVHFIGFADSEEIPIIYQQSIALVMPTFFGPTNIPPLEAFNLGVPVLYSDLTGLRDQVEDAALLMDLKNPETMAQHLDNLLNDNNFKNEIIQKGYKRLEYFNQLNRKKVLNKILEDFIVKLSCWKNLNDN